jgi:methylmalonyl-CoA mutase N-terminal domain/subunit
VAKFRAARRLWARIMRERFGAQDERSLVLRFHTQTGGATLTAQQPENNIVRTTLEALSAVLGGTQSLHTNAYDEALALPTEASAKIALRTQQVIGYETGVGEVVDPLGGSYYLEALTDELERLAVAYIEKIDGMGGAVAAIEQGFYQDEIHEAAFRIQQAIEREERIVVGVNRFRTEDDEPLELQRIGEEEVAAQVTRVRGSRASRDQAAVDAALTDVTTAAEGTANLLPPMRTALRALATLGEVSDVLRGVFGEYRPSY